MATQHKPTFYLTDSEVFFPFLSFGGTAATRTITVSSNDDQVEGPFDISGVLPYDGGLAQDVFVSQEEEQGI